MICEAILGNINEDKYKGKKIDYVDIEWFEAFKKLHKKTTYNGEEIGIRLDNEVLTKGLNQGDVLFEDADKIVVVNIPECEVIEVNIDENHPKMVIKATYDIGNKHATLFWGDNDYQLITPYNEPTLVSLNKLHGVKAVKKIIKLNFDKSISSSINSHTH